MIDAFRTSGSSPTLKAGATTLHGRGITEVRESIRKAFGVIHSNPIEDTIELTVDLSSDISAEQLSDERSERSLSDRAGLYIMAAERRVQRLPLPTASSTVHFVTLPTESADELIQHAVKAMGSCR